MTRKELEQVLFCLKKIKQPNEFANEAIASVERDIARRKQQSEDQKDIVTEDTWPF
jgi:hypothetical protein